MTGIKGKKILLGVTGGIAAYKSVELVRLLSRGGAEIGVVMTANATRFVTPLTFQALSGKPPITDLFSESSGIDHIRYTDWADIFIIAPATANIIGKAASGIGDDALSTMLLAFDGPVIMAPAMNSKMYRNPIVQDNIKRLASCGYRIVGPEPGELACGREGMGRMSEPETILEAVITALCKKDLADRKFLVTAGPTMEPIDPVRYISNRSSGKMGYALAREAARRGAEVTLVSGPTDVAPPPEVCIIKVATSEEMLKAVTDKAKGSDAVVMAAAVADYRPSKRAASKIKKSVAPLTLQLEPTVDILKELGREKTEELLVGFAAETEDLLKHASMKLKEKNLDLIVANDITEAGAGFDVDTNRVYIIDRRGIVEETPKLPKEEVAERIMDVIASKLGTCPRR